MQLEVGKIYEGKVTGITKFGAFVDVVEDGKKTTGMVHISEVANTFVSEIKDHLQEGQIVKVKVLTISEDGKVGMSIKKALPQEQNQHRKPQRPQGDAPRRGGFGSRKPSGQHNQGEKQQGGSDGFRQPPSFTQTRSTLGESGNQSFEDMLSKFKASSDEKLSGMSKLREGSRRSNSHRK